MNELSEQLKEAIEKKDQNISSLRKTIYQHLSLVMRTESAPTEKVELKEQFHTYNI